jgi:dTDP-4-dehydrorhamnose reductase
MSKRYKVLITGSSGMLGIDLSHELRSDYVVEGTDIVAADRQAVKFYQSDITDRDNIAGVISDARANYVVHAAAWTDVDGCEREKDKAMLVNAQGARNVAVACAAAGAVMIYISTDFVFDGGKRTAYKETDRTGPLSVYGASKLAGEEMVRKELKSHFILRTSWLYGPHGKNFVDTIVAKGASEKMLKVVDDQIGSPTYTVDLSRAIHALLDRITNYELPITDYGLYHVSNAGSVSWYDYATEILKLAGSRSRIIPISSAQLDRPARRPAMSVLDNAKFRRLTGYRMRSWKTALKYYMESRIS